MDYKNIYTQFISDRKSKELTLLSGTPENMLTVGYEGMRKIVRPYIKSLHGVDLEIHHIVSKHDGGGNTRDNLVFLTPGDHLFAHLLLAKATNSSKDWAALWAVAGIDRSKRSKCNVYGMRHKFIFEKARVFNLTSCVGIKSATADKKIYSWVNVVTDEKIKGTRQDIPVKSKSVSEYFTGKTKFAGRVWFCLEKLTLKEAKNLYSNITDYSKRAKKASLAASLIPSHNRTSVICIETGKVYESQKHAFIDTGALQAKISEVCNGKRKRAGGYTWAFS